MRWISLGMALVALGILVPGLTLDMLTVKINGTLDAGQFANVDAVLLDETRSILGTISHLWDRNLKFVSFLVLLFSVVVPMIKLSGTIVYGVFIEKPWSKKLSKFLNAISKWSMAVVFVVAVLMTILSLEGSSSQSFAVSAFAFKIDVNFATTTVAKLHSGFYYFVGYCILSIASLQLLGDRQSLRSASKN